jgi:drug/metabolite transporter (DMT)-like permease
VGYLLAGLAALVSGVAVFVNSLGVRTFADPVLYTALKDGVTGLILLLPLGFSLRRRAEYRHISGRTWGWLIALALTGGSLPFALFFSGLRMTTAATGALINHFQFILVAVLAVIFLRERIRPAMWAGFGVLLIATVIGTNVNALRWNQGALLILASTLLFAVDFVIAKHLLRGLSTLVVMTARMSLGTAMLFVYVALRGGLGRIGHLSPTQWEFVVVTGLILLVFTITTFTAIRNTSVSVVLSIGTAAPIVTTLLQLAFSHQLRLGWTDLGGLLLLLLAVGAILVLGIRQERMTSRLEQISA